MEVLTCLLNGLCKEQDFHLHPNCETTGLNHLCFADDLFIFCKGDTSSVQHIKDVLDNFHSLSGLKTNPSKSQFFCAGLTHSERMAALHCLGFQEGYLPSF